MKYYFKPGAIRDLKKLPKPIQKRILNKLDFYFRSNNPLRFAKSLKDKTFGDFRFRIGEYRIIFDLNQKPAIAVILTVGHRKDIYR